MGTNSKISVFIKKYHILINNSTPDLSYIKSLFSRPLDSHVVCVAYVYMYMYARVSVFMYLIDVNMIPLYTLSTVINSVI